MGLDRSLSDKSLFELSLQQVVLNDFIVEYRAARVRVEDKRQRLKAQLVLVARARGASCRVELTSIRTQGKYYFCFSAWWTRL